MPSSLKTPALSAAGLVILLISGKSAPSFWQSACRWPNMLAPVPTFQSLWDLLIHNQLTGHIIASLKRVAVGLLWALAFGVPLGLLIGQSALAEVTGTSFQFFVSFRRSRGCPWWVDALGHRRCADLFFARLCRRVAHSAQPPPGSKSHRPPMAATRPFARRHPPRKCCKIMLPAVFRHVLTRPALPPSAWCGVLLVSCEMLGVNEGLRAIFLSTHATGLPCPNCNLRHRA